MAAETPITLVGNLVDDPVLRFTASGVPVASFRVASTARVFDRDSGSWRDGDTLFMSCSAWRQQAQNVASTCRRGTRVVVVGRMRQRSYTTTEGANRTVVEVEADEVGASLRHASGQMVKNSSADRAAPPPAAEAGPAGPSNPWQERIDSRRNDQERGTGSQQESGGPVPPPSRPAAPPKDSWAPPEGFDSWGAYPPLEDGDEPTF